MSFNVLCNILETFVYTNVSERLYISSYYEIFVLGKYRVKSKCKPGKLSKQN